MERVARTVLNVIYSAARRSDCVDAHDPLVAEWVSQSSEDKRGRERDGPFEGTGCGVWTAQRVVERLTQRRCRCLAAWSKPLTPGGVASSRGVHGGQVGAPAPVQPYGRDT